jgi:hypothetical protein
MDTGEYIPVEECALNHIRDNQIEDEMFSIPQFNFKHIFSKLDASSFDPVGESEENAETLGDALEAKYQECLEQLNFFDDTE